MVRRVERSLAVRCLFEPGLRVGTFGNC